MSVSDEVRAEIDATSRQLRMSLAAAVQGELGERLRGNGPEPDAMISIIDCYRAMLHFADHQHRP